MHVKTGGILIHIYKTRCKNVGPPMQHLLKIY
jgi:hypothetical protein